MTSIKVVTRNPNHHPSWFFATAYPNAAIHELACRSATFIIFIAIRFQVLISFYSCESIMYSSRGNNAYGQQQPKSQPYSGQSAFGQNPGDGASLSMASRHSSLLGSHPSAGAHYGGQYTSVYGSSAHSSALQVPALGSKGAGSSVLEGRSGYDSPKYASAQKYGQKGERMFSDDRLPYAERTSTYSGRDLQSDSAVRYADSLAFGHQHKTDIYDRLDAATALRQELLQSGSVDGSSRQADYLAARSATVRHGGQELLPYSGRYDADLHSLSMISGTQHAPSILGAAPRRDVEDLMYAHGSANPGYGVSLPPGRAYVSGKSLESDYPDSILARAGYSRLDDRKDDVAYAREIERREEDRRREILRERERERERDRERERKRERERERERERSRERRREREKILERREKEREREIRRDRTPSRVSRDRGRSTSTKPGKTSRRESPRRHSPAKEKPRDYVCKVYSSNLVDSERDYLSMDKRYPRLYVSPECSKVVVNWSREDLNIPFNTPVSFEHDFVQEETPREHESASTKALTNDLVKLERATTRWNAKMLLMSGLSHNAWEELSSERSYEDRIPHLCNMLRFAYLKDGNSSMAIGGSWDTVDGSDPSIDKSVLVQTVLRYAKELTGLDLKNCRKWNPFLEIHYDRIGKDGLFSHKEITVLYIPDLSDCLPSVDAWRDQWLAHKKAVAERERLQALKREKLREKKENSKDKETEKKKDLNKVEKAEKKKEVTSASKVNGKGKDGTKLKAKEAGKEGAKTTTEKKDVDETILEKKDGGETITEKKDMDKTVTEKKDGDRTVTEKKDGDTSVTEKKDKGETVDEGKKSQTGNAAGVQTPGSGKKKIIRKVVKKKVVPEKAPKQDDANPEVIGEDAESSGIPLTDKSSIKKKAVKKTLVVKTVEKEDEVKEPDTSEVKIKNEDVVGASSKTIVKKKIVKKVTKKKLATKVVDNSDKVVKEKEAAPTTGEQTATAVKLENKESVSDVVSPNVAGSREPENKSEKNQVKEEKKAKEKGGSDNNEKLKEEKKAKEKGGSDNNEKLKEEKKAKEKGGSDNNEKLKEDKKTKAKGGSDNNEKLKDGKEKKDKDVKTETKGKEVKDKKKVEEPPRHPGLILQTKGANSSKVHSLSRSLDSLLDYTDKDIEESTFELSVFAETFYEMLQFQMGSRILSFLQKLRIKFVAKRNQKKRQREEVSDKKAKEKTSSAKKSSPKRQKTDVTVETVKTESGPVDEKTVTDDNMVVDDDVENTKSEDESVEDVDSEEEVEEVEEDAEEDLEEEPEEELEEEPEELEEDENMADAVKEDKAEVDKVEMDVNSEKVDEKVKVDLEENGKTTVNPEKKENQKVETKKKETPVTIDKKLLQAFRFFDRNRVGYIRVEDLRLVLHALGTCMSHRDVKELVQSALLESNTGRDDRVRYSKLVKMTDI
ncbi:hypothetical protein QVD17_03898 [Tagetes erecta]|uniref:EF-hand domain-containing protein n=1 Tax=Tagetes erecta TaxID=13708 RepID=A0AAD8L957_TARER|nr:hypothetical protein QVD17_03898 [Tagetes erecta]